MGGVDFEDNTAEVFALACLSCLVLPWALVKACRARAMRTPVQAWLAEGFAPTSPAVSNARAHALRARRLTLANVAFAACVAAGLQLSRRVLGASAARAPFDPYDALGLSSTANETEVRSAYRRLAAELHPDKNPSVDAASRFITVAKAKRILTDPVARDNYARYGSPDGRQFTRLGMALPSWMAHQAFLAPLFLLLFGLPVLGIARARKTAASRGVRDSARDLYLRAALGVGGDSRAELGRALQAARARQGASAATLRPSAVGPDALPELLARAFAHSPFRPDVAQQQALDALASALGAEAPKSAEAPKEVGESSVRARALMLRAHAARVSVGSALGAEMAATLIEAPALLESFFQASLLLPELPVDLGVMAICRYARRLTQAMREADSPLLQAPHFDEDAVAAFAAAEPPVARASELAALSAPARAAILRRAKKDADTIADVDAWAAAYPRASVRARAAVAGEADDAKVHTGDVVTISIDLEVATRRVATLGDGRVLAHAPRLPLADKAEVWLVILYDARGRLRGVRPAPPLPGGSAWSTELQVRFGAAEIGPQTLRVLAACGACEGADASANVNVDVLPPLDLFDGAGDDFSDDRSDGASAGMSLSDDEDLDSADDSGSEDEQI